VLGCVALDCFVKLSFIFCIIHFHIEKNRVMLIPGGAQLYPVTTTSSHSKNHTVD